MRIVISSLLLAAICNTGHAEWREVVGGPNSTGYADVESIRHRGDTVSMRVLIDYQKPPFDGNNLPYRSLTMQNEYRCDDARFRVLAIASHADNMGRGARPYTTDEPGEWEPITKTSIQRNLWKLACANWKPAQSAVDAPAQQKTDAPAQRQPDTPAQRE